MKIGYTLSSEEWGPRELVRHAQRAEECGFHAVWISDHFHPWTHEQGHSPFVWSTIGAIAEATDELRVTTGVTCPTVRMHPALVAHAAATCAVLLEDRFQLGVGSGEALNEHVVASRWPEADERLEMLEEAIEVIRLLWRGGQQSHRGRHYRVENAELFDLPAETPPIIVSGFGPKATDLAARVGDGYATTSPDADLIGRFRSSAGAGKPVQAGTKVCWAESEAEARRTAHRLWPTSGLSGEMSQILPTPEHFEQAAELVTEDKVAESIACGPDLDAHLDSLREYADAGVDELFVQQVGPDQEGFFRVYEREVLPQFGAVPALGR
jgi:G6PDH family F420-dependent oxidoreductase